MAPKPKIEEIGLVRYREALELMEKVHAAVAGDHSHPGLILVTQHPPVVTMGNRFLPGDMNVDAESLPNQGVDFVKIDRGGSVTVHEPGQAVVYPILRLDPTRLTVKTFVTLLEEAMIRVAGRYGVTLARDAINPGVWAETNKVGALGIRVLERVTKHGLALNVCNDLSTFRWIVPCGIRTRGVSSLSREAERALPAGTVAAPGWQESSPSGPWGDLTSPASAGFALTRRVGLEIAEQLTDLLG